MKKDKKSCFLNRTVLSEKHACYFLLLRHKLVLALRGHFDRANYLLYQQRATTLPSSGETYGNYLLTHKYSHSQINPG